MSAWPGKYVIGLTGNIATGKSVVRKMLEHLGAYGIDADALGHRAIAKGAPGYQPVVGTFGTWVLDSDGQIDRSKLAKVAFSDPQALALLEGIVHPLVEQAVDILVRRSSQEVIVIEAIKLIESNLRNQCDAIWVTQARTEIQLARLMQKRGMNESTARQRINVQAPQSQKTAVADVVIRNDGSFEDTWRQVAAAWQAIFPAREGADEAAVRKDDSWVVQRARPQHAGEIAEVITRLSKGKNRFSRSDVMAAFGEKAYLTLKNSDRKVVGLVGWKVENLVARTDEVYVESGIPVADAMRVLMDEVERASKELQCEISLLFLPPALARREVNWRQLGYQPRTVQSLGVRAWEEAAAESMPAGSVMLFKQLRQDRVLRPV